MVEILCSPHP